MKSRDPLQALMNRLIFHPDGSNHRSVTKEVVHLIEAGVAGQRPKHKLSPPLKLKGGPVTIEEIEAAIAEGRD
ncbi:MAG: hypothetical protein WD795_15470 [Woeseia sp.]